jgi:hypothetical protein
MKYFTTICCAIILFSSCKKEVRQYTTDFQDQYTTRVDVIYDEHWNQTTASVTFLDPIYFYTPGPLITLELPSNCELKMNGQDLVWQPNYYEYVFDGQPDCEMLFQDADGPVYANTIMASDSIYFINFPDTVSSTADFQFQWQAVNLDTNERIRICLDGHGDDYGDCFYNLDSAFTLDHSYLQEATTHWLYLYREKSVPNPSLPLGGGYIEYSYVIRKKFYSK